jgi:hypothetical protein
MKGGILPPGGAVGMGKMFRSPNDIGSRAVFPPGRMPRLYGRQDARHYAFGAACNFKIPARGLSRYDFPQ